MMNDCDDDDNYADEDLELSQNTTEVIEELPAKVTIANGCSYLHITMFTLFISIPHNINSYQVGLYMWEPSVKVLQQKIRISLKNLESLSYNVIDMDQLKEILRLTSGVARLSKLAGHNLTY